MRLVSLFLTPLSLIFFLPLAGLAGTSTSAYAEEAVPQPERMEVVVPLKRGNFTVFRYVPGDPTFAAHPRAIIIFGSGDGGFDGWEHRVCQALQSDGYEMLGFDCALYAYSDYDLPTLQADMAKIAASSQSHYGNAPPPLIMGGWSMGADQSVAAAGGPRRPPGLVGLLLISPGDRGRYGLRVVDRFNVTPTGGGTFALADFSKDLEPLRIAQWNGNLDIMGSKKWLDKVSTTHKSFDFPWGMHDYDGASEKFLKLLDQSIAWILQPVPASEKSD